eukprot:5803105-Pleurochrysis_carterae.AAC.1
MKSFTATHRPAMLQLEPTDDLAFAVSRNLSTEWLRRADVGKDHCFHGYSISDSSNAVQTLACSQ